MLVGAGCAPSRAQRRQRLMDAVCRGFWWQKPSRRRCCPARLDHVVANPFASFRRTTQMDTRPRKPATAGGAPVAKVFFGVIATPRPASDALRATKTRNAVESRTWSSNDRCAPRRSSRISARRFFGPARRSASQSPNRGRPSGFRRRAPAPMSTPAIRSGSRPRSTFLAMARGSWWKEKKPLYEPGNFAGRPIIPVRQQMIGVGSPSHRPRSAKRLGPPCGRGWGTNR